MRMRPSAPQLTLLMSLVFVASLLALVRTVSLYSAAMDRTRSTRDQSRSEGSSKPDVNVGGSEPSKHVTSPAAGQSVPTSRNVATAEPEQRSAHQSPPPAAAEFFKSNPAFYEAFSDAFRMGIRVKYHGLFAETGASKEQIEQFEEILLDGMRRSTELPSIAAQNGLSMTALERRTMELELLNQRENAIREVLGEEFANAYVEYTETSPARDKVDRLDLQLMKTGEGLALNQATELRRAIAAERSLEPIVLDGVAYYPKSDDFETVIRQARQILTSEQAEMVEASLIARQAELAIQAERIRNQGFVRGVRFGYPQDSAR